MSLSDEHLDVSVVLRNEGGALARGIAIDAELLGNHSSAELKEGIGVGESRSCQLRFPPDVPYPGTHAVTLLLDYTSGDKNPAPLSQRAYLLLALGESAEPTVLITLKEASMNWAGLVTARLESLDGRAEKVRLRLEGPRGMRVNNPDSLILVPAKGGTEVSIPVFKGSLPWDSVQGVLCLATTDGPLVRTAVATGVVRVSRDPAWLPRVRRGVLVAALALLGLAAFAEVWKRLR